MRLPKWLQERIPPDIEFLNPPIRVESLADAKTLMTKYVDPNPVLVSRLLNSRILGDYNAVVVARQKIDKLLDEYLASYDQIIWPNEDVIHCTWNDFKIFQLKQKKLELQKIERQLLDISRLADV